MGISAAGSLGKEYIVLKRGRVTEIDGFSAKVMVRIGGAREFVEPDRARLLTSTRPAEGAECDRIRLRTTIPPEGVDMA